MNPVKSMPWIRTHNNMYCGGLPGYRPFFIHLCLAAHLWHNARRLFSPLTYEYSSC